MSEEKPGREQPRRHGRRAGGPRWLLVISLALNLLVLAWIGAAAVHWSGVFGPHHNGFGRHAGHWYEMRDGRGAHPGPMGPLGLFLADRPDEPALARLHDRHAPPMRTAFLTAREARAEVRRLLEEGAGGDGAGGVNAAALADALAEVRRATAAVQVHMHEALVEAAETLEPAAFAAMIDRRDAWRDAWRDGWRDRRRED